MRLVLISFWLIAFASLATAETLNVTKKGIVVPSFVNTNDHLRLLNLSFVTDTGSVNITWLNLTFNSTNPNLTGAITNLTVCVYDETFVPVNCTNEWDENSSIVYLNVEVSNTTNTTLYVGYYINRSIINITAVYQANVSIYLESSNSIRVSPENYTVQNTSAMPYSGEFSQIQDLHAVAGIKPHYVDTNVVNQSFVYVVNTTGQDNITELIIFIPSGFTNVGNVVCTDGENQVQCNISLDSSTINISSNASGYLPRLLQVNFTANTNQSGEFTVTFTATISGGNLTNVSVGEITPGSLNVTTKRLIDITSINAEKSVAFVNGTDYWLFNFTINITAPVNGTLQLKLTNWTSISSGKVIPLVNESGHHFAFLGTNKSALLAQLPTDNLSSLSNDLIAIENEYVNTTYGLPLSSGQLVRLFLKMIIPADAALCCYSDWFATFSMLFRTSP